MHRFFVAPEAIANGTAVIEGEDVQHMKKVLRLSHGDEVTLCDGRKTEYTARIERMEKECITFQILASASSETEPRCSVTLYQGLPKAGKLETIVQKCVELGVSRIIPFQAARSVVQLSAGDFEKKRLRYARVAYEAAKQSRRGIIPEIGGLADLSTENLSEYDLVLLAYEEEHGMTLKQALRCAENISRLALIIGPEGGFACDEVASLAERSAVPVSLGPRILRTETAGMAALAMALYELEG